MPAAPVHAAAFCKCAAWFVTTCTWTEAGESKGEGGGRSCGLLGGGCTRYAHSSRHHSSASWFQFAAELCQESGRSSRKKKQACRPQPGTPVKQQPLSSIGSALCRVEHEGGGGTQPLACACPHAPQNWQLPTACMLAKEVHPGQQSQAGQCLAGRACFKASPCMHRQGGS